MSANTLGEAFRATTFGESHGAAVGVVVDGCPAGLPLAVGDIQADLDRRRPGTGPLTSPRQELDRVEVVSGLEDGVTLGTPLALWVANRDARASDYQGRRGAPRPSHADFTTAAKYGRLAASGGGRASARETVGRVAAGAVARRLLAALAGVEVVAWVCRVHDLDADPQLARREPAVGRGDVDAHPTRCPDPAVADAMAARIAQAGADGDSLGGVVEAVARRVPAGWGEPVFDKLEACLARALLSIPACRGFEIGSGFSGTRMRGSEHNDPFVLIGGRLRAPTNRSGGVQGGISNGEDIVVRAAFKPPASIARPQASVDADGQAVTLAGRGRHDPCVLPRAVPIVEAMVALVLADHLLRQRQQAPGYLAIDMAGSQHQPRPG